MEYGKLTNEEFNKLFEQVVEEEKSNLIWTTKDGVDMITTPEGLTTTLENFDRIMKKHGASILMPMEDAIELSKKLDIEIERSIIIDPNESNNEPNTE